MNTKVYLDRLGYRDALEEPDFIIWFWTQEVKHWRDKKWQTRFWVNLYEINRDRFKEIQAFELLYFLKTKATDAQLEKRAKIRLETQAKNQLLLSQCEFELQKWREKDELVKSLNYN